ncbi:type 4a pilus biogenesis protein PilO [Clostridium botulinum C]|uniref:Pilus assembly protein PilO n=2 Tax=Clostridium botulinum TaxID=1491 RepID=A0A9Q4TM64_CLOBO|nr:MULTISPECIES: type 4a pilus biogenesis protein PilO [Clostridium]KEI06488.1 hypothetical protein Z957_11485 [Clostridium sp. K25]MCD3193784.1 type 4a pilus biogenesis protein PilO [Clostridium botulinum C]MCD3199852.1 type 4a pilus biogenesis protein PilO [Clostridium botulinum C]MCD3205327.1 type 4a pilus biogenesis protein PilO [Clostridium botulinum C]MCD3207253.1 type 4a pilus biogenesis protein PilO [Clostridium botulinum C]
MTKINKREKILLRVLSVLIIFTLYYKGIYSKQIEKINLLKDKRDKCHQQVSDIRKESSLISSKESSIKILNAKIQRTTEDFFPDITQEIIILKLNEIIKSGKLDVNTMEFTKPQLVKVEKEGEDLKKEQNILEDLIREFKDINKKSDSHNKYMPSKNKINEGKANYMSVNIQFQGTYEDILDFIKRIEDFPKYIKIKNIKVSQNGNLGINGSVTLEFYAIPKIEKEYGDLLEWNLDNSYGKVNPFDGQDIISRFKGLNTEKIKEKNSDFIMCVKPMNSTLPTMMLGKGNVEGDSTYIYEDNPGIEEVYVYLTKQNDKYFYKYNDSKDRYPQDYNENGEEFILSSSTINFNIYSNNRLDNLDNSGVKLNIINNTDKTVALRIKGDDKNRPRVTVSQSGSGKVDITRD